MAIVDMLPQPGGSSEETLTVLWENENPSSSFSAGRATLTESLAGYKRMRIEYRPFSSSEENGIVDFPVEYLTRLLKTTNSPMLGLGGFGSQYFYNRLVYLTDETLTILHFLACYRVTDGTTGNSYCVPLYIYGIK